jgi:hypothetical protein
MVAIMQCRPPLPPHSPTLPFIELPVAAAIVGILPALAIPPVAGRLGRDNSTEYGANPKTIAAGSLKWPTDLGMGVPNLSQNRRRPHPTGQIHHGSSKP